MSVRNILAEIVEHKRREVAEAKRARPVDRLVDVTSADKMSAPPDAMSAVPPAADGQRPFATALLAPGIGVIAEIKRRSPSKGPLREDLDPVAIAREHVDAGAAAISVLTDERYFGGSCDDLRAVRDVVDVPILRKDFTVDAYQLHEAAAIGANAILLIARVLSDGEIRDFLTLAGELHLDALVEVHDDAELDRTLACGARIVGVNNRNLDTFEVSLETCLRLKKKIPDACVTVAESGIATRVDVERLIDAGFDAMLVGETLMRAPRPGAKLRELLGVGG